MSLRFGGEDLDLDEISAAMGTAPDMSHSKGDPMRNGNPWRRGLWSKKALDAAPADLNVQIRDLLATLTDDLQTWKRLERYAPDIFVGLFLEESNEGISLKPDVLQLLAERGLTIDFDIYDRRLK